MSDRQDRPDTDAAHGLVNQFTSQDAAAVSEQTVARLSLYRRLLTQLLAEGETHVASRDLATLAHAGASQVRRDIMALGFSGSHTRGYSIAGLMECIANFLYGPGYTRVALMGVGNLGLALLSHFSGRWRRVSIRAAFDTDTRKTGQSWNGVPCHAVGELARVVRAEGISLGMLAVPAASAQQTANALWAAGVRGLVNFAPIRLSAPGGVYVDNVDMTSALDKVAFFARATGSGADAEESC